MKRKQINAAKLQKMGYQRVRDVCVRHAYRMLTYQQEGNRRMANAHCSLLDQCAAVGRKIKP